jgi:D-alanyl-D-alanine carboxypeptidase (penicillin-binding protein 5/6)
LKSYAGAEGLKTGYTTPAGFNLITIASRENKALIGVITGGRSAASRDKQMVQMLDRHFGVTSGLTVANASKAKTNNKYTKLAGKKPNKVATKKITKVVKVATRAGAKQRKRVRG